MADSEPNAYGLATEIRMLRPNREGAFLIVEGDADARLYKKFTIGECLVINGYNKSNVLEVVKQLTKEGINGILGIVDADFTYVHRQLLSCTNIILTDTHDLETMILNSTALSTVLLEYGSSNKIAKLPNEPIEIILRAGTPLGCLRWLSMTKSFNLKFEDVRIRAFINEKLDCDVANMIETVCNHSSEFKLTRTDVGAELTDLIKTCHEPWQMCCGPDLVRVLTIGLHKLFGSHDWNALKPEAVAKLLHVAYTSSDFSNTQVYASVRDWESQNRPYVILAN